MTPDARTATASRAPDASVRHHRLRRPAVIAAVAVLILGSLALGGSQAQAQTAQNSFPTTITVVPGGTLVFTITGGTAVFTGTSTIPGCPATGISSQQLTYTCGSMSNGIPAGTIIQQFYSGTVTSVTETATYNANGPVAGVQAVAAATSTTGNCTTPSGTPGTSACGASVGAAVVPGGTLELTATGAGGQTVQITNAPSSVGNCPLTSLLPTGISAPAGSVSITYTCTAPQTIPINTNVTPVTVATAGAATIPAFAASANANAPLPGISAIPAPQTVPISGAAVAPAITGLSVQSGAPGTYVTLTGTNLTNATAVNFGTSPGVNLVCTPAGTSCTVAVPAIVPGTVNVAVVTPGGPSNAIPFTVLAGGPSPSPFPGGIPIATTAGWNIVAGPTGTAVNGSSGVLYTYQATDNAYESIGAGTPLQSGFGYWAYFNTPGSISLPSVSSQTQTVSLPASHWVMIGNPGNSPATVTGADIVYTYNPAITSGSPYTATTTLQPGQGGWAISINGGQATVVSP